MALVACKDCGKEFSTDAAKCPNCGANKPPKRARTFNELTWLERFMGVVIGLSIIFGMIMLLRACAGDAEQDAAHESKSQAALADFSKPLFTKGETVVCDSSTNFEVFEAAANSGHANAVSGVEGCYFVHAGVPIILIEAAVFKPTHIRVIGLNGGQADAWTSVGMLTNDRPDPEAADKAEGIDRAEPLYAREGAPICRNKKAVDKLYNKALKDGTMPPGCTALKAGTPLEFIDEDGPVMTMHVIALTKQKRIEGLIDLGDVTNNSVPN